ncbi:MAG: GGDEF domain-containing response regulator, partial [Pseudoxanthomonas sp.]|nr:GGDEF domain-containing response regulator [Pseudoxanthomonas sp.]
MSSIEPTSRPQDEPARSRMRAETPPPRYWRRWVEDAPAVPAAASAAMPEPSDPASASAHPTSADAEPASKQGKEDAPYRILIVEDDRGQALFAQSVLHGAGMLAEVEMLPDGVLQAIARFKPDLVL